MESNLPVLGKLIEGVAFRDAVHIAIEPVVANERLTPGQRVALGKRDEKTGRWKVFRTCDGWIQELRLYHRVDGLIVKERDDRICASRYAMMMLRHAVTKPKLQKLVIPNFGVV